jgi:L-2,4-diaminobutyric acid acetyltransferase
MDTRYTIREPEKNDAKHIYDLVKKSKVLDLNSQYLYLLQSTHFKNSCSVALFENQIIGFVSGYYLPNENDSLFIWQVAVDENHRGKNLALNLIDNIVSRKNIRYLISTVSPSNISSQIVFEKFAKKYEANIKKAHYFL